MKKGIISILFLCVLIGMVGQVALAFGTAEVKPNHWTMTYNVMYKDRVKAMVFAGDWGLTHTIGAEGRFIYHSADGEDTFPYLDLFLKFKLHESSDLALSGRAGIHSDFNKISDIEKTLGLVLTKTHNSFIKLHGGVDYFLSSGQMAYFGGLGYDLSSRSQFQVGWQRFAGSVDDQGFIFGLRTEI